MKLSTQREATVVQEAVAGVQRPAGFRYAVGPQVRRTERGVRERGSITTNLAPFEYDMNLELSQHEREFGIGRNGDFARTACVFAFVPPRAGARRTELGATATLLTACVFAFVPPRAGARRTDGGKLLIGGHDWRQLCRARPVLVAAQLGVAGWRIRGHVGATPTVVKLDPGFGGLALPEVEMQSLMVEMARRGAFFAPLVAHAMPRFRNCSIRIGNIPTIDFQLGAAPGATVTVSVAPRQYLFEIDDWCFVRVVGAERAALGFQALCQTVSIFDREHNTIGFCPAKDLPAHLAGAPPFPNADS